MKKIRKYYRITFRLISPMSVGSGENNETDRDLIRDSRGIPYIPGSSLAGIYRGLFSRETAEKYFGPELNKEKIQNATEETNDRKAQRTQNAQIDTKLCDSAVITYDAFSDEREYLIAKRDMVELDEYKTAVPGGKFDFQILEPGVRFVTFIEQQMDHVDQQYVLNEIADAWRKGKIRIGAKTGRGYGQTECIQIDTAMFDLEQENERNAWLDFDLYDPGDPNWNSGINRDCRPWCLQDLSPLAEGYEKVKSAYQREQIKISEGGECSIVLELKQQGGISVRKYTTEPGEADYMQLTSQIGPGGGKQDNHSLQVPVIPGTSWAGAFQAQMGRLDSGFRKNQPAGELFFGRKKDEKGDGNRTRIRFSESRISGGRWVRYTRNAIDRFTGGTVAGALYTEKTYYYGTTKLVISCDFGNRGESAERIGGEERKRFARALAAAILDLHNGYLAVGGLTAVGRGLFSVEKIVINGNTYLLSEQNGEQLYPELVKAIAGKGE